MGWLTLTCAASVGPRAIAGESTPCAVEAEDCRNGRDGLATTKGRDGALPGTRLPDGRAVAAGGIVGIAGVTAPTYEPEDVRGCERPAKGGPETGPETDPEIGPGGSATEALNGPAGVQGSPASGSSHMLCTRTRISQMPWRCAQRRASPITSRAREPRGGGEPTTVACVAHSISASWSARNTC